MSLSVGPSISFQLVHPDKISEKTLHMIDKAVKKYKEGDVSEPIDLEELEQLLD